MHSLIHIYIYIYIYITSQFISCFFCIVSFCITIITFIYFVYMLYNYMFIYTQETKYGVLRCIWLNYVAKVNKYVYCSTSHETYNYL